MRLKLIIATVVFSALGLTGCSAAEVVPASQPSSSATAAKTSPSSSEGYTGTSTPEPSASTTQRAVVIWADYDAGLQADIDNMTSNQDCQGLQTYFGMVTATEDSVKSRTGHGNEALNQYLTESVSLAGCG